MLDEERPKLAATEARIDAYPEDYSYHSVVVGTLQSVLTALGAPPDGGEGTT